MICLSQITNELYFMTDPFLGSNFQFERIIKKRFANRKEEIKNNDQFDFCVDVRRELLRVVVVQRDHLLDRRVGVDVPPSIAGARTAHLSTVDASPAFLFQQVSD